MIEISFRVESFGQLLGEHGDEGGEIDAFVLRCEGGIAEELIELSFVDGFPWQPNFEREISVTSVRTERRTKGLEDGDEILLGDEAVRVLIEEGEEFPHRRELLRVEYFQERGGGLPGMASSLHARRPAQSNHRSANAEAGGRQKANLLFWGLLSTLLGGNWLAMDVVGQLGGYALGEVLSSLNLDTETIQQAKRGLGVQEDSSFSRDSIYNGKFVDEEEEPYDPVTDLEAQVDREMKEEFTKTRNPAATLLRGEEDDFDDDDDDDDDDATPPAIKQEEEPTPYRFQSLEPIAPLPPMRQVPVKDLFPTFEYNQVLTFTDLFTARPRKKPKIIHNQIQLSLPSTDELPRSKSTRDLLLAPLRPTVKNSRLRSLLIEAKDGVREDWQDEGDSHDQLVKAIEVRSLYAQLLL